MSGTKLSPFAKAPGTISPHAADSAIVLGRVERSPFGVAEPAPTEFIPSFHADNPEDLPNGMGTGGRPGVAERGRARPRSHNLNRPQSREGHANDRHSHP